MAPGVPPPLFVLLLLPASQFTAVPSAIPGLATPEPGSRDAATTGPEGPTGSGPTAGSFSSAPGPSQASSGLGEEPSSPLATFSPGAGPGSAAGTPRPSPAPALPATTPRAGPWPAPVTDVAKLCVCDLLVDQCDVNCCCDPVCSPADFSLFTACSVPVVTGDSQLCRQQEALYSINPAAQPPERRFQLADKVNPSVFCIQTANYKAALSFQSPEIPTSHSFDRLLEESGQAPFHMEADIALAVESETQPAIDANETGRYEYGDPIQTLDGFLKLPAPLISSQCADSNPAGFLVNQALKCNRMIKADECSTVPALSMQFYTRSSILAVPASKQTVNITIQSIIVQTLEGLRRRLQDTSAVLLPTLQGQECSSVVLGASYLITFTETGKITSATVSFVLGTIEAAAIFVQQSIAISFIQQDTQPIPVSGSPGYIAGLPIRGGFRLPGSALIQIASEDSQFTMLKSTPAQDCLTVEGVRTPLLFGYNTMSGCQLRITKDSDCKFLAPTLLRILKGQNFPDCVSSFGNSLPQNGLDWVQIYNNITKPSTCEIPVSFEVEVKWTKYGSLVNPQAKIVSLTATVITSALPQVSSGSEQIIQMLSSATFVDVSAPAKPGYKARPTIDAKLPFDFFFPFV